MGFTKAQLEDKFGVPCYVRWNLVPKHLHTRNALFETFGVKITKDAKPDAVKGGGMAYNNYYSFLYDENKYLPAETITELNKKQCEPKPSARPKLKKNFEE